MGRKFQPVSLVERISFHRKGSAGLSLSGLDLSTIVPVVSALAPAVAPPLWRAQKTMDEILSSCPTPEDISVIQRDFGFTSNYVLGFPVCGERSVMMTLINAFRCMKALTFDSPIPAIGEANLYAWMRDHGIKIHILGGEGSSSSADLGAMTLSILEKNLVDTVGDTDRYSIWASTEDPETAWVGGSHMAQLVALLVHESQHAISGKVHDCSGAGMSDDRGFVQVEDGVTFQDARYRGDPRFPEGGPLVSEFTIYDPRGAPVLRQIKGSFYGGDYPVFVDARGAELTGSALENALDALPSDWNNDSSLEYGGAWAAQYWFYLWCAEHSGAHLSENDKRWAKRSAEEIVDRFCRRPSAAALGSAASAAPHFALLAR